MFMIGFRSLLVSLFVISSAHAAEIKVDPIPEKLGKDLVARYGRLVSDSYERSVKGAQELREKIAAFVKTPSNENLEAAKNAWKKARDSYSRTEVFRFYGGPIDHPETGPE